MYSYLMVLSDPVKGREDEYNDWYSWVHIRDVMRLSRVVVAVQRFKRAAPQVTSGPAKYAQGYLAIYENTDPVQMTADHKYMLSDEMPISSAYNYDTPTTCAYYDLMATKTKAPGARPKADLILEWIEPAADKPGFAEWYTDTRFPALMALPGVITGSIGRACAHQMPGAGHRPEFNAIYRTTDLAATVRAWNQVQMPAAPWKEGDVSAACFTPLIERVTLTEVMEPDAVSRDTAKRKRDAIGDRRHKKVPALAG